MGFIPDTFNNWQAVTQGTGSAVKTRATTPTGSFNPQNRVYTVDTGSYPTSRLLVSTQYGPFVQATSNTYQAPNQYEGPEYWRFKIAASATESESALLLSPAFLAPSGNSSGNSLIDIDVLLQGLIQSNGTGFAHLDTLSEEELAEIANFLTGAYTRNAVEKYKVAVNGEGIKKSLIDPAGTDPRYQDGFGLDMQYGQRVKASGKIEGLIKKNISRGVTTDNASLGKWNASLYGEFKQEIIQANANFKAAGYNPVPRWLVLDVREAAPATVADYVAGYQALIQKFSDDGLINTGTKFLIIYPFTSGSVNDTARQDALYDTDPTRFIKIKVGVQPTIDGTHGDDVCMRALGNEVFNKTHNTTTPVVTTPSGGGASSTITDQEPTGPKSAVTYSPAVFGLVRANSGSYSASPALQQEASVARTGLQDAYLAANTSGLVYFQYLNQQAINGAIGFHTAPNRVPLGTMSYGCYASTSGQLAIVESGKGNDSGVQMVAGSFYGVKRIGNTGVLKVVTSTDETNWTTVYTYTTTTKAALYSVGHLFDAGSQIQVPKSQSLSPLAVPTPTGHLYFELDTTGTSPASGGLALIDVGGASLTEITFWLTFTPTVLGPAYQEIIGFGHNGAPSEGFNITEFPDGALSMRVHSTNDGYSYSTGGTGQQNGVLLTAGVEVLIVGRITAGSLRMWVGNTATPEVQLPAPMLTTSTLPLHLGATYKDSGAIGNQTSGSYGRFGLATRGFTDAEVAQVQAANGAISTIAGTIRLFEFANMLNSTSVVKDSIDSTKTALIYSGAL